MNNLKLWRDRWEWDLIFKPWKKFHLKKGPDMGMIRIFFFQIVATNNRVMISTLNFIRWIFLPNISNGTERYYPPQFPNTPNNTWIIFFVTWTKIYVKFMWLRYCKIQSYFFFFSIVSRFSYDVSSFAFFIILL